MRRTCSLVASFVLISMGLVLTTASSAWASDTFSVLYDFDYYTGDFPIGNLIFDSAGNLYGTTSEGGLESPNCPYNCGVVFELSRSGGAWTYTVLYYFTGGEDGGEPHGRLTLDSEGNLYGTAYVGGLDDCPAGCGTVFELSPSNGNWTFALLHSFAGSDGSSPWTGLTPDNSGNLYGTTTGAGSGGAPSTIFELVPSGGGGWTFSTLYYPSFSDGTTLLSDLAIDGSGNLYGAASEGGNPRADCDNGCGTVFELSPSGGSWNFSVLHTFRGTKNGAKTGDGGGPLGALALDSAGNLYGTTEFGGKVCSFCGGTVFKLSQSSGKWKEQILHRFGGPDGAGPMGGVTMDETGNLYGTTNYGGTSCSDCGTVFKLAPRKGSGWKFTSLYSFTDGADGGLPYAGVISVALGNLYGTTSRFGPDYGGTLFELSL